MKNQDLSFHPKLYNFMYEFIIPPKFTYLSFYCLKLSYNLYSFTNYLNKLDIFAR